MIYSLVFFCLALLTVSIQAAAIVEGNCTANDVGLQWLQRKLSSSALISCKGSPGQIFNAERYWGVQFSKVASVVVFPVDTRDVSLAVQATSKTPLGKGYAFVSGGHSMTNASSSYGMVIDLSYLNKTKIIPSYPNPDPKAKGKLAAVVAYEGGSNWAQVDAVTQGTGWTAVGARISNVGVGGFSTGGGIGFLAGAYGYAMDRLVALEVVLPSGEVVMATKWNKYADLFWAFQGGGGQFGIITTFYQEAAVEPSDATIGVCYLNNTQIDQVHKNVVNFFKTNTDPFSIVYFSTGFLPDTGSSTPNNFAIRTLFVVVRLSDPTNPSQPSFNTTFAPLLANLTPTSSSMSTVPFSSASAFFDPSFPYGFRRGFYGPQTTSITVQYLRDIAFTMTTYINTLLSRGDVPATTLFVLQYMFPGLNGHLPPSDSATAWPHAIAGHQTLFSPAWSSSSNDALTEETNAELTQLTYARQKAVGEVIWDYPNYISPGERGERVWGGNLGRLERVKEKYDCECAINRGRVFASKGCRERGFANVLA